MGIGKALLKAGKSVVKLTPIGKRIEAGVCDARVAVNRNCIQLVGNNNDILNTIKSNISSGGINQAIDFANRNNTFQELLFQYVSKTLPKFKNVKAKTDAKAYQEIIEKAGITPTKIAQMLSDDPEFLSKIEDKALIVALKNTKSKCSFNQTVQEAQMRIDTGFEHVGGGGIIL